MANEQVKKKMADGLTKQVSKVLKEASNSKVDKNTFLLFKIASLEYIIEEQTKTINQLTKSFATIVEHA